LNAKTTSWLLVAPALLATSCTTGRLTRVHQDCGVTPFAWSALKAPPGNAGELISAANIAPPRETVSQHWFAAGNERLLLCRVNARFERGCNTQVWVFERNDGQWKEDRDQSVVTVCEN
jgi:hypothetical protein